MILSPSSWHESNQRYLETALERIRMALQNHLNPLQNNVVLPIGEPDPAWTTSSSSLPALATLHHSFALTAFEQDILVLCAGVELSASLSQLCAKIQGSPELTYPTFSLALAVLPAAHWSALTPARPLRHWRLIEVNQGENFVQSRLRIDERILHFLNGVSYLDDRLRGLVEPLLGAPVLPPSHHKLVEQIVKLWTEAEPGQVPIVQLCGDELEEKEAIAIAVAQTIGMELHRLRAYNLPAAVAEREALAGLCERESILSSSILLVDYQDLEGSDRLRLLRPWLEILHCPLILAGREPLPLRHRPALRLDVQKPATREQLILWQSMLREAAAPTELNAITAQFTLGAAAIEAIATEFNLSQGRGEGDRLHSLWQLCRTQSRTRLEHLAQRIEAIAGWEDLVLPDYPQQTLRELAAQVKQRTLVYDTWEFARRGANGLGISALFVGASGTGKTIAAEVLANELQLDLYRIDLSQMVSKYIGETEKNLKRVFDAAETGGAILLFDEADALFGKRSEIKDSHDRHANIEVSYLLQRIEAYRGLAILTSNFRSAIDPAFLRRIRFVVTFPFPDHFQRRTIWQRMFPPKLPTADLDFDKLARLNIAGGNIRNIALNAAFLAADADEPVQMKHLLRAAQSEYSKLEKTLTETEVGGWT
jgi:hypothetical protein